MSKNIVKQDILDYFTNLTCENCEFKEECNYNENEYDSVSLCTLLGVI